MTTSLKSFAAIGVAALSLALLAPAAIAKTTVQLRLGSPFPWDDCMPIGAAYHCRDYDHGNFYQNRYWREREPFFVDRIDCYEAKELVLERGFRKVKTRDCDGRLYTFTGIKRGHRFLVKVNAFSGRIASISEI